MLGGILKLRCVPIWVGHRALVCNMTFVFYNSALTNTTSWPIGYILQSLGQLGLRTRVNGAKDYCQAPERVKTHCRPEGASHRQHCHHVATLSRQNVYDNMLEYWVVIRERGSQEDAHEVEERSRTVEKAWDT